MIWSVYSLLGAFIMLVFGLIDYTLLRQLLYRPIRVRYERAKVTASQGLDPDVIWALIKLVNMVALPVAGFVLGDPVLRPLFQ